MNYVSPADEHFPAAVSAIEDAASRLAEKVERERAKLVRSDGSPVYGPAEHQERHAAILAEAGAAYDAEVARHLTMADAAQEKAEAELAKLDGADGWERLTEAERQAAATRQPFIAEDAATLPADEAVRRARAAVASGDEAAAYVWLRGLERRPREAGSAGAVASVVGELRELLGLADQAERRRELARKVEAAKSLRGRVDQGRRRVDGRHARMEAGMRRQLAGMF